MKTIYKFKFLLAVTLGAALFGSTASKVVEARGGGGRPSMGHVGGGGGRPSGGGHPGGGGGARPAMSHGGGFPGGGGHPGGSRPSMGQAGHPSGPAGGGFHPSGGGTSNFNRTPNFAGGAGGANRPSVSVPNTVRPATHPSFPGGGTAGNFNRPATLPGSLEHGGIGGGRPGFNERPGFGNLNHPSTLPANIARPGIGGNHPNIGGGNNFVNHPSIGGGNNIGNRANIGNSVNIGGGNNFVGNHPAWAGSGYYRPGWGLGGAGNWANNWHNNVINPHYGWYNGPWTGYWGSGWYSPLAWGAVGWGLGSMTSGWGYGSSYYNPYYSSYGSGAPYNYSQPVVVNNYLPGDPNAVGGIAQAQPPTPATNPGMGLFDQGLAQFKAGDYRGALANFDAALQQLPNDPVVHEVRAQTLFALGNYPQAGAALNSLLSSAPGMDWTTMSSLYGNPDDYTAQLRNLEQYVKSNPNDAPTDFVLAYEYLVIGAKDQAVKALQYVVKNQPRDGTAQRMLDALVPPQALPNVVASTTGPTPGPDPNAPTTDLVGNWQAKSGPTTIELGVTDDSKFTWKAIDAGKPPVVLNGQLTASSDSLTLQNPEQGAMEGTVKSLGPDNWQFTLAGAPPQDPGLKFQRVVR